MHMALHDVRGETAPEPANGRSFAAKKAMFAGGGPLAHLGVPAHKIKEIGVTSDTKYFSSILFERAVALNSPVVAAQHSVFIGAYSYMNSGGYIRDRVMIGRYCSIGRRVTIGAGMHDMSGLSTSPLLRAGRKANAPLPCTMISHDVWIGDGVIIMPGISVGIGAVIGANAVVTHDVADYSIVGGVPARPIGMRFGPEIVQRLIASGFWELPPEYLNAITANGIADLLGQLEDATDKPPSSNFETYSLLPAPAI